MTNMNQIFATNSYELNIISQDEMSRGKVLKKYDLNGERVIGIYEGEQFLIQLKNKTWNRIAVKISVDGTNIIDGSLADTSAVGEMWICEAYGVLELKAFPETNKGGAAFQFSKPEDSVAVNTHGIKTGIGYIAAAIFIEEVQISYVGDQISYVGDQIAITPATWTNNTSINSNTTFSGAGTYGSEVGTFTSVDMTIYSAQALGNYEEISNGITTASCIPSIAVGAGEYINQEITKVAGLNKPILASTISIRYEWWVSLRSKIRQNNSKPNNPAFPGDHQVEKMIDLKNTPRNKKGKRVSNEVKYPELNRFG